MEFEQILFEKRGRVGLITLNRPEKLNAWTPKMMAEMRQAIDASIADRDVAAIAVTGAGRAFCAGADVSAVFKANADAQDAGSTEHNDPQGGLNWVTYIQNLPKPTIAAINGTAVGIGITQILPFDIRIASSEAKVGMFFVRMGLVPELASSALLPQMIGSSRALEWCLSGRLVGAEEARDAGLVSEVVAPDQLIDRAVALGEQFAGQSALSMTLIRKLILEGTNDSDYEAVGRREGKALEQAYSSWEHREAIAAFMEKRAADFTKQEPTLPR
ncbi:MAG: enoyl-CoA hydratase-related protein [Dehalococcoidia bacterium]|nr:enoyl-CoA hydratase-related protein [Dehalococcoidia bacterium]